MTESHDAAPSTDDGVQPLSEFHNCDCGGQQNISTGHAKHSGHGDLHMYGGVGTLTHHFEIRPKEDFSFRHPVGLWLGHAPYLDPGLFIGRDDELHELELILKPADGAHTQRFVVLGGVGGVGKTQVAITYARRHQKNYTSVFWLNASSEMTMKDSFCTLAATIFPIQDLAALSGDLSVTRILSWLSNAQNTGWLLIYDNYDSPENFDIKKYYPHATHGAVIVTTRQPYRVSDSAIRLQPLTGIENGLAILQTRSCRKIAKHDLGAKRLAQKLAGLPLALATAGVYLRHSHMTFECYLEEYEQQWNVGLQRSTELPDYQGRTLYTTWNISLARLVDEHPLAVQLLKLLAYFDPQRVWYDLLRAGLSACSSAWMQEALASITDFDNLIKILVEYCFVEIQPDGASWSIHNCVHDWILSVMNEDLAPDMYWHAFDCVAQSFDGDDVSQLSHFHYGHIAAQAAWLTHARFQRNEKTCAISVDRLNDAARIAALLGAQNKLLSAEQMLKRALAGHENGQGPGKSTLTIINNIGWMYQAQDKLEEAKTMYLRALAGLEKEHGPDDRRTLLTVNNLGSLYCEQGDFGEAEQMFSRALSGYEKALGADHPLTVDTVYRFGCLCYKRKKLVEAEQLFSRALTVYRIAHGLEHLSTHSVASSLAVIYCEQGRLAQAEHMYLQSLARSENLFGPDHNLTLKIVGNLGILYLDQDKLTEAETMLSRALSGNEKSLGPSHTSCLDVANNLGVLYLKRNKLVEADRMFSRALEGFQHTYGPDHSSTLATMNNLGRVYRGQGNLEKAAQMYTCALLGFEKMFGPDHMMTLLTTGNLGNMYRQCGKLVEAEQNMLRAVNGYEKVFGPEHHLSLGIIHDLGLLYFRQGKLLQAERMFLRAHDGCEKALGPTHTSTRMAVNSICRLYQHQGRVEVTWSWLLAGGFRMIWLSVAWLYSRVQITIGAQD